MFLFLCALSISASVLAAGTNVVPPCLATRGAAAVQGRTFRPWQDTAGLSLVYGSEPKSLPTGCAPFEIARPKPHAGAVVDAADFGVSEAIDDNNAALQRAVDHCRRTGAAKLVLRKGTYRFFGPRSVVFDSLTDFTFDAQGATLVFRRPSKWRTDELIWQATFHPEDANFFIRDCSRCLFTNYNMDWDWESDPLATVARVVAVNPDDADDANSSVEFELVDYMRHPFYPNPMPFQTITPLAETRDAFALDPGNTAYPGCFYYSLCEGGFGRAMSWLAPNRIRFWPMRPPIGPGARTRASDTACFEKAKADPRRGRRAVTRFKKGCLYRIAHYYPGKSGIYMEGNRDLTLENANVWSCRGMAHVIDGPQHHTHLHHVHVVPKPGSGRTMTATADSCHVANSLGYLKLEDFRVALNQDDFSNIHDRTSAGCRRDVRTIEITHPRGNLYFGAKAGDLIEVRNPDFSPANYVARVVAVAGERLTLDRDVPDAMREGSILFNRSRGSDHVWWKDCVMDGFWGRATMMCSNLTFENCVFRRGISSPLKIQAAFHPARWAEGMGATNHLYRGCTFENNQMHWVPPFGNVVAEIFVGSNVRTPDYRADLSKKPWNGAVDGILFRKCRFVNSRGALAHLYSGRNLCFVDNEIVLAEASDRWYLPYRGSIFVDYAEDLYFSGNRVTGDAVPAGVYFGRP